MAVWLLRHDIYIVATKAYAMSNTLVITDEETKTTWRMPRELFKDLKRYALEYDTNVTSIVVTSM